MIHANGLELEAEVRTKRGLQAVTSYVQQDTKQAGADTPLTNSPRHMVKVRVAVPVGPRAFASAEWQFIGERSTLAGETVGAASVVHLAAGWPITRTLALTGSVREPVRPALRGSRDPTSTCPTRSSRRGGRSRVGFRWTIPAR